MVVTPAYSMHEKRVGLKANPFCAQDKIDCATLVFNLSRLGIARASPALRSLLGLSELSFSSCPCTKKGQLSLTLSVPRTRLELARTNVHYPLKVACLPISPPGQTLFRSAFLPFGSANIGRILQNPKFSAKNNCFLSKSTLLDSVRAHFLQKRKGLPALGSPCLFGTKIVYLRSFLLFLASLALRSSMRLYQASRSALRS